MTQLQCVALLNFAISSFHALSQKTFDLGPLNFIQVFCMTHMSVHLFICLSIETNLSNTYSGTELKFPYIVFMNMKLCMTACAIFMILLCCAAELSPLELAQFFWRAIGLQCYRSLRIMHLAYYIFGKSRANLPPIKFNFTVSNAFLRQPAV